MENSELNYIITYNFVIYASVGPGGRLVIPEVASSSHPKRHHQGKKSVDASLGL